MFFTRYKPVLNRWLDPLGASLARCGISPSAVTLAGLLLTALICLIFLRTRAVLPFCAAMAVVGCLDVVDGAIARAGGGGTKAGAYLDAVCDRYVDVMVVLSAAAVTGYWLLSTLALIGALLTSYAKARAGMEVPVSNLEWPDLMERGERSLVFGLGLVAGELIPWRPAGRDLFWWALLLLAVLTHATVLQRVQRALRLIRARS